MNWVFCNRCSLKFNPSVKFHLLECGHVLCEKCIPKIKQTKQCGMCNVPTSIIELSKDMDPSTQMFFWPLENLMQQSLKVYSFQTMHKTLFLQSLYKKYNFAKKQCITYYNANKKLQNENQIMKDMLKAAGYRAPPPFITSTPAKSSTPNYDSNVSMLSSVRFTPGSMPGSAQRMYYSDNRNLGQPPKPTSINFSDHGPSPAQTVPNTVPMVPVHREPTTQNPAAATPTYMDKYRGKSGFPSLMGYPRK